MDSKKPVDPRHHHRQRVRDDFLLHGIENYEPHRVLELLLFYAIPRKDTKPIAYRLIQQFNSLNEVFDAPIEQLTTIEGISTNTAIFIKLISEITKRYYMESVRTSKPLVKKWEMFEYLRTRFIGESAECVYLLTLDSNKRPISCKKIAQGISSTETTLYVAQVVREAAISPHSNFVLAHNHPDGEQVLPSISDEMLTKNIAKALFGIDKKLCDHMIISGDKYFSFEESFGNVPM